MRYTIKTVGAGSERIGVLSGFSRSHGTVIETPTSALLTKGGSVIHLTGDVLSKVFSSPQLLWVPLSNSLKLINGLKMQGEGVCKFSGLSQHIACCTFQDLNETTPLGHFESDYVPLWTRTGKKLFSAEKYMNAMDAFKSDLILAIADNRISLNDGPKRIAKAVDRTCSMLDICMKHYKESPELKESGFIAVIVGASKEKESQNSIQRILLHKDKLTGVALSGLADSGENAMRVTIEQVEPIFKQIGEALPLNLARIIEGCWNPSIVVAAIDHGWDIFDGSYPVRLTNNGLALRLIYDENNIENDEMCILDINDIRYKQDFRPILEGCDCIACKKHTRAYINHLLTTRELLAPVLLSIHNLHNFDKLFKQARYNISMGTFQEFKTRIIEQYERYRVTITENEPNQIPEVSRRSNIENVQIIKKKKHVNGDIST